MSGCFQVDLFYHPDAFASLDTAFDPATNAQAAARILSDGQSATGSWESSIALYHSATPMLGARYLRQVQAVWPWARLRSAAAADAGSPPDPPDMAAADQPRVLSPRDSSVVLQWAATPQDLPVVLKPNPGANVSARGRRALRTDGASRCRSRSRPSYSASFCSRRRC